MAFSIRSGISKTSQIVERTVILRSGGGKAAKATKNLIAGEHSRAKDEILWSLRSRDPFRTSMTKLAVFCPGGFFL